MFVFFKQKTAYEMRISDWSSDVCSSDLAYSQAAGGRGGSSDLIMSLAPLVLIFAVFYFLLIRPQQKKMKEHREMLANVRRNDRIVTNGGLVGVVTKVSDTDDLLTLEVAAGVKVQVARGMIAEVRGKGQPVASKPRSEEHTSELQSLMRISYAVFCLKKKKKNT